MHSILLLRLNDEVIVCGWVGLRLWTTPAPAPPGASLRAAKLSNFPLQRNFNLGGRDQRVRSQAGGARASINISKNWAWGRAWASQAAASSLALCSHYGAGVTNLLLLPTGEQRRPLIRVRWLFSNYLLFKTKNVYLIFAKFIKSKNLSWTT